MAIYGNIENVDAVLLATVTAEVIHVKGADGKDGAPGKDGVAATVAVGTVSTGAAGSAAEVVNRGTSNAAVFDFKIPQGAPGKDGSPGKDGKTAYQYAVESGYTGTETEFAKKLASGALTVHVTNNNGTLSADKSYSDIWDAIHAGISVFVDYDGNTLPLMGTTVDAIAFGQTQGVNDGESARVATVMIVITSADEVYDFGAIIDTLPNPQAITFTGAVAGSYDGSEPLSVNIPTVPTKTSQLTNDSGYLTLATLPKYGGETE